MVKRKQIGLGSLVQIDFNNPPTNPTYVTRGFTRAFTPPARESTEADGKLLTELLDVPLQGIEAPSEFVFTEFWHPGEAEDQLMETKFDNRLDPDTTKSQMAIRLVFPHGGIVSGATAPTAEFKASLRMIGPNEIGEANSIYTRAISCRRTSDITYGTFILPADVVQAMMQTTIGDPEKLIKPGVV